MPDHSRHKLVRASLGEPDAAVAFQFVDERVDRAGRHRVSADEQGVKRERLPQLLVANEARDRRVDGSPCLVAGKLRGRPEHAFEIEKRDRAQLLIALDVNAFRIAEKAAVALDVRGLQSFDLPRELLVVIDVIEGGAVGP